MSKHIVIVDGAWAGHHAMYAKVIVKVLLEAGYRVSMLCPAPNEMEDWASHLVLTNEIQFRAWHFTNRKSWSWRKRSIVSRLLPPLECLLCWVNLAHILKKTITAVGKPDLVFLAWLDNYLNCRFIPAWLVDKCFPFFWSGLYFHPRHHRKKPRFPLGINLESLIAKSRFARSVAILDAGIIKKVQGLINEKPVFVFPDFSDETPASDKIHLAEAIKAKAGNRQIIGMLGGLTRRKGVLTLVRIANQYARKDWFFVFAGLLQEHRHTYTENEWQELMSFFSESQDNCFFYLNRIPDDAQFNELVKTCDVIFGVYEDFLHSSNLVTKAANYGVQVLVNSGGYMEEVVSQFGLGVAVPSGDIQAAASALDRLTSGQHSSFSPGMRSYAERQSKIRLQQVLLELVTSSLGKTGEPT